MQSPHSAVNSPLLLLLTMRPVAARAALVHRSYVLQRDRLFSSDVVSSQPNLHAIAYSAMIAAYASYPLTFVLREAAKGKLTCEPDLLESLRLAHDLDLSTSMSAADFLRIVEQNRPYLEANFISGPVLDDEFSWFSVMKNLDVIAGKGALESVSLLEFDDHNDVHRLAYGIAINKSMKRITVFFRGTYAENTDDWKRNLQFDRVEVPLPTALRTTSQFTQQIHRGFWEYMFRNSRRGPSYPKERYDEIMNNIVSTCENFPDYELYITGHSLGGSLALLVSFFIAVEDRIPKPITCVSIGSPPVGDQTFQDAFELAEQRGWINHLRITNDDDPIPLLPPFPWYKPVGVHLQLSNRNGFQISHSTRLSPMDNGNSFNKLWGATKKNAASLDSLARPHYLPEYLKRVDREKDSLKQQTLKGHYQDLTF